MIGRDCCFVLFETSKGAVFFACNLYNCYSFTTGEKQGAGTFFKDRFAALVLFG